MYISTQKSSFNYLGGKYSVLPWLLPMLPECYHFVDVFGGSGVVILNRKPSPIDTYNDINRGVVNFFRVLKESPQELIARLELTPHSRFEYNEAWDNENLSNVERAEKFFIRTQQSIFAAGAQSQLKGWASSLKESRVSISEKTHKWIRAVPKLWEIAERFKHIQIEEKDFRFMLRKYDSEGTLFYLDSPYDQTFRSETKYQHEMIEQDFVDMRDLCLQSRGKVAVSGYGSDFMKELFADFNFYQGPLRKNNKSDKKAYECLWTNYEIDRSQPQLFK